MFPVQLRLDLQARFLEVIRTDRARTKGMYERRQFLNRDESEWFISQMNVLLQAVNEARAGFGKPPIDMQALAREETQASGHYDYAEKLALYAAFLVEQ